MPLAFSVIQVCGKNLNSAASLPKLSDGKHAPFRCVRGSHTVCLWIIGYPSGRTFWAMVA